MLELAVILIFISITGFFFLIFQKAAGRDRLIKTRLERLKPVMPIYAQTDAQLEKALVVRLLGPVISRLSNLALKITPINARKRTEELLDLAGISGKLNVNEFLAIKTLATVGLPLAVYFLYGGANPRLRLLAVAASLILGMIFPDFLLKRLIKQRQAKIAAELPDTLDLLTVSVEAGLGFDQALLKIVEKTSGPLAQEIQRVLHEIRIGATRRDAMRGMADRTGVEDLQTFTAAIIQADQLGVSIGNVLRIQSGQLRLTRRQRAEERAQKAPVKMLIPMILFIFPSLFIILLGPGILQLIDNFLKMKK